MSVPLINKMTKFTKSFLKTRTVQRLLRLLNMRLEITIELTVSLSLFHSIGHWCVRPLPFHTTHIRGSVDKTRDQSNTRGIPHVDDSVDSDTQHSQSDHLRVQIKRV